MAEEILEIEAVKVNQCVLTAADGNNIDLSTLLIELILNQSIDAPFMTGKLLCSDSQDISAVFSLSGNETLSLSISPPGLETEAYERTFRVYRIERAPVRSSSSAVMMHFCSQEGILNLITRVNKSYSARYIDEIVSDVLASYLNAKDKQVVGQIEATVGQYNLVVPDWRPIETLNWCCSRAYDVDKHAYHFYETRDGFMFRSLQTMYNDMPGEYNARKYSYEIKSVGDDLGGNTDKAANRYSFDSFNVMQDFDVVQSIGAGAYSLSLLRVDVRNQTFVKDVYNTIAAGSRFLNEYPPINDEEIVNAVDSNFSTYISTEDGSEGELGNRISNWFLPSRLHKNLSETIVIEATLPGNMLIKPGTSIFFNMPEMNSADAKGKRFSEQLSGKYLIKDVVQVVRKTDTETFKLHTNLTLCSDSFSAQLPSSKGIANKIRK